MTITFRQLEVFRAVAEDNSFTRASQKLLVAQSTISQHIRELEVNLRTKLFDRNRRNIALSGAGEVLLEYAHRVFGLLEEAEVAAKAVNDPYSGKLSFGCGSTTLLYQLPPILMEYARKYPHVEVNVTTGTLEGIVSGLRSCLLDLALVVFPVPGQELRRLALFEESYVAVLPVRHRLAKRTKVDIGDLTKEPFILYRQGTNTRKVIDQFFHRKRIAARVVMELDQTEAIKEMVAKEFGVALVPAGAFITNKRTKELKTFSLGGGEFKRTVGLIYLRSKALRLPAQALCEFLQNRFNPQSISGNTDK